MKRRKLSLKNEQGFAYLSLIIGITILLMGFTFFMPLIRSISTNITMAKERMAMATVAQSVAQMYLATNDEDTARNQGIAQGYSQIAIDFEEGPPDYSDLQTIIITVRSNGYADDYTLVFYTPVIENP